MLITFNIPVMIEAFIGKMTKPRQLIGTYPVEVDIPVLDDDSAPVVATLTDHFHNGFREKFILRKFKDGFYNSLDIPVERELTCERWSESDRSNLFDVPRQMIGKKLEVIDQESVFPTENQGILVSRQWQRSEWLLPVMSQPLKGDRHLTDLADFEAEFRRSMENVFIAGGKFFRSCPEPFVAVRPEFGGYKVRLVRDEDGGKPLILSETAERSNDVNAIAYFRLSDFQEAVDFATHRLSEYDARQVFSDVVIYDQAAFDAPVEEYALADLARVMVRRFETLMLEYNYDHQASAERIAEFLKTVDIQSFLHFRKMVNAIDTYYETGDVSAVEDCVSDVVDAQPGEQIRYHFINSAIERQIALVWERWNGRIVEMGRRHQSAPKP